MGRLFACAVLGILTACVRIDLAGASPGGSDPGRWSISAFGAYSPTAFGGDTDGSTFPGLAVTPVIGAHWSLRTQVQHFAYSDYPDAGPAHFTPVGVGARYRIRATGFGPFLQAIPTIIVSKWGGSETGISRVRPGAEVAAGVSIATTTRTAVELSAGYLVSSSAGSVRTFDAPATEFDGLSQTLLRVELSVAFGH